MPHAERALDLELPRTANSPRMEIELLPARIALHRGNLLLARDIVAGIRARKREAMPAPAVDVLCTMVEYACASANQGAWEALEARSAHFSIGQERIEVIEARAVEALRSGRMAEARGHFVRAIDTAQTIPNAMGERLAHWMTALSAQTRE
jgi:eukaryotic-like serine/threonine-protein kinase